MSTILPLLLIHPQPWGPGPFVKEPGGEVPPAPPWATAAAAVGPGVVRGPWGGRPKRNGPHWRRDARVHLRGRVGGHGIGETEGVYMYIYIYIYIYMYIICVYIYIYICT